MVYQIARIFLKVDEVFAYAELILMNQFHILPKSNRPLPEEQEKLILLVRALHVHEPCVYDKCNSFLFCFLGETST